MTLLLTRLDIHGFKSFATPTTFLFDRGITAIIGPNGSGKSNVAEALRWVLGEQGYANLRGRRTEDVIFSGSERRPALGMAEVTVTFDNRDGDLPLEFNEITVSRRAFRSGENQYLINGARVRLKDVQQLVAPLGQAYTIIGQGLVDAALSQRPEERRGLFEHAAGIGGLRLRAVDAERGLAESAANAERLRDILGELEPRVRSLERAARLAREYSAVRDRLRALQHAHYARQWRESEARVAAARRELRAADAALGAVEEAHVAAGRRLSELRGHERALAEETRRLAETIAAAEQALNAERHRRELLDVRLRALAERLTDRRAARDEAVRQRDAAGADEARCAGDLETVDARLADAERRLAEIEAAGAAIRARRTELDAELARCDREALDRTRERAAAAGALGAIDDRLRSLMVEHAGIADALARDRAARAALCAAATALEEQHAALGIALAAAEEEAGAAAQALAAARLSLAERERDLTARERELAGAQARFESLERTHLAGEGLYAGVRAVVRAVRGGRLHLPGMLGPLAELIEVPAELETAIEVALGAHLQDIVVERWADAETAIDFLQRTRAGRATFQPLDAVRPARRQRLTLADSRVLGIAADLVGYDRRIDAVIANTLGRVVVVADLDTSRRLLHTAPGWTIVTLGGEITRPSGSVTGGSRVAEAGMLARERERRALPAMIAREQERISADRIAWERDARQAADLAGRVTAFQSVVDARRHDLRSLDAERARIDRDIAAADAALARHDAHVAEIAARRAALLAEQAAHTERVGDIDAALAALAERREEVARMLAALPVADAGASADVRAEIAALRERRESLRAAREQARARAAAARHAAAERAAEIERLQALVRAAEEERAGLDAEIAARAEALVADRTAAPPVEQRRAEVARQVAGAERDLDAATVRVRDAERERDRASLALARAQDEQVFLAERIRNDLDLDDPARLEAVVVDDDTSGVDPAAAEAEIQRLRDRLRRMAVVGEDALEDYERESARLAFLSAQLEDIEQAAEGLRAVLSELHARMAERFQATFREVGAAFEATFTRLFGGGTARLALHTGDDGQPAIEIVAQPPGKRLTGLTALSGGERALTAVALLIAIQRVNPSPFCLLDEVDAALDEANVLRFRDELRDLAGTTQFIVITHNRGTIEGADVLYGVTMGEDSISRVVSLRLEDAVRQAEARDLAEAAGV